jgi:hypothetical protein
MSRRLEVFLPLAFVGAVVTAAALPGLAHAADAGKPKPAWLKEKHILEIGGYMGGFFTAADHGLYGDGITKTARPLKTGFDVGVRIAYLPLRFVGIEAEGGVVPTKLDGNGGYKALLYGVRGHVILQMPTRLALFVVAGGGILGVSSGPKGLGKNLDGTLHIGGGLKYYVTPKVVLRIDGRDILSPNFAKGTPGGQDWAHNAEFTFGASFVLGRKSTKMLPKG